MTNNPNKLTRFWQELKRRKVTRIITIYAAAAFVILQLVEILAPSLRLPEWTMNFILVLLIVGFIIAVIISWTYDVSPEGGIMKTEPAHKVKPEDIPKSSSSWKIASYISFAIILGLVIFNFIGVRNNNRIDHTLEKSIAVLPFHSYNINPESEDIGDAFANEIITQLYKIKGFDRIISHTSTLKYKGPQKPSIATIGEELNATYIIEGSLELQNENVSIQIQIIHAANDDHVWAEEFKGKWEDIFSIRASIAKAVADALEIKLSLNENEILSITPTQNLKAWDLYAKGRFFWNKRTEEDLLLSLDYFKKAAELDPQYAQAWAGIADSYAMLASYNYISCAEGYSMAKDAAEKALELNQTLVEPYATLGYIYTFYNYNWQESQRAFETAFKYEPSYATAHSWYAWTLTVQGRLSEAREHILKARNLDPLSNIILASDGWISTISGSHNRARQLLSSAIELNPKFPRYHLWLGYDYWVNEQYDSATFFLEKAVNLSKRHPQYLANLGFLYGISQQPQKASGVYDEISAMSRNRYISDYDQAILLLGIGQIDLALEYFNNALQAKDMWIPFLAVDQRFNYLRHNPDFIEILQKTGLQEMTQ